MNIIEAVKSGKRFRRKGPFNGLHWYGDVAESLQMRRSDGHLYFPDKEDILADDWEVETVSVTIDEERFNATFRNAACRAFGSLNLDERHDKFKEDMKIGLGFK